MSTPPDEPTRPLPPAQGPPPRVREREYLGPEDDRAWVAELQDQMRSLKTAVALLGVLTVAALALAAWALLKSDDDGGSTRSGASPARVSRLEDRVDGLETKVENRATKGDVDDLSTQQKDLADRVDKLESQSGQSQDAASKDSVDQISQDLQDLAQRVDDVEQQQQQDQNSTP